MLRQTLAPLTRLLSVVALLCGCSDSSVEGPGSITVEFVDPASRAILGCVEDEDPATPALVDYDVTVLVSDAGDDLNARLVVDPAAGPALVRPVPAGGIVRFRQVPLAHGGVRLTVEVWRGAPPARGPDDAGVGACQASPGQCPNVCMAGAGVEGELCQASDDCRCGLFCKAATQACAPYEGELAGCGCGAAGGGVAGGASPLASASVGVAVESCGGLPVDAGPGGGGDSSPSDGGARDGSGSVDGSATRDAAGLMDTGPALDAARTADAARVMDAAQDGAPDMRLPGEGQHGDVCRCGSDCESGFCVENKLRAARTCTVLCEDDRGCPGLDTCVQAVASGPTAECPDPSPGGPEPGEMVGVCHPNETGLPCEAPRHCTLGICLQPPRPADWINVQNVCSAPCSDDSKCPVGFICQAAEGAGARICSPDVEAFPCRSFEQCGGVCNPDDGSVTACINIAEGGEGYCSCTCSTAADCPRGFACDQDTFPNEADPRRPGHCVLMAGYRCPAEAEDPNARQCPSLSCAVDGDHPERSACTALCRVDNDCPAQHRCEDVGGARACLADQPGAGGP